MKVTLRLYRQHDLDLITLYRHPSFSLPIAMKTALCAYVRNERFHIRQPEPFQLPNEKISKIIQMHIYLNETKDKDVIKWIKGVKEGFRNSVLKNIIRSYLVAPCVYSYASSFDAGVNNALTIIDTFESNIRETVDVKGRNYRKSFVKKKDDRKVEDSEIAAEILSKEEKKNKPAKKTFIERIDDDDTDVKALENITKPDAKEKSSTSKPQKEKEQEKSKKEKIQNNNTSDTADTEPTTLDDMLDDIDAMMDGI